MIKIEMNNQGNLGNKMFRYVYLRTLQTKLHGSSLSGYDIPEFNLRRAIEPLDGRILYHDRGHDLPYDKIAYKLNNGVFDSLHFGGYVQRLEYYSGPDSFGAHFFVPPPTDASLLGPSYLTINVRAAEILRISHTDYGPVPVSYFVKIAEASKLSPVLVGQLGDDDYSRAIISAFAGCPVLPRTSALSDFSNICHSTNVVIGVSSYSWIAAWISKTAQCIHMPIKGFFHPRQRSDVDVVPLNDERYRFYEFPISAWEATPSNLAQLLTDDNFNQLSRQGVRELMT